MPMSRLGCALSIAVDSPCPVARTIRSRVAPDFVSPRQTRAACVSERPAAVTYRSRSMSTSALRLFPGILAFACLASTIVATSTSHSAVPDAPALVTLSIVGTSDLHGAAFPRDGIGGLPLLAGYVNNLRAARAKEQGTVVLVDSGDTFQGGIESNLTEGSLVVDAYSAMGYAAEALGKDRK